MSAGIQGQNGVVLCACGKGQPDDYSHKSTHAMVCTLETSREPLNQSARSSPPDGGSEVQQ